MPECCLQLNNQVFVANKNNRSLTCKRKASSASQGLRRSSKSAKDLLQYVLSVLLVCLDLK